MSGRPNRTGTYLFAGFLLVIALYLVFSVSPSHDMSPALTTTLDRQPLLVSHFWSTPPSSNVNKRETINWNAAHGLFRTDSAEPLILYRSDHIILYVQNNELRQLSFNRDLASSELLLKWNKPTRARSWLESSTLLLGVQQDPNEYGESGSWYVLTTLEQKQLVQLKSLGSHHYGPQHVVEMKISHEPLLFFVSFYKAEEQEQRFWEYVLSPSLRELEFIDFRYLDNPGDGENYWNYYENPPGQHEHQQSIEFSNHLDHEAYSFIDDYGALVYVAAADKVYRYVGQRHVEFNHIRNEEGKVELYARLRDEASQEMMNEPGQYEVLPFDQSVWQDGWTKYSSNAFYKIDDAAIRTVVFHYNWKEQQYEKNVNRYPIPEQTVHSAEKEGSRLKYTRNGREVLLSLMDLLHYVPRPSSTANLNDLWLQPLPEGVVTEGVKAFPFDPPKETKTVKLPDLEPLYDANNTNAPVPDELRQTVDEIGSGDGSTSLLYRKLDEEWYVLHGIDLYQFDNGELNRIGSVPAETTFWITNYIFWTGPLDFTRSGEFWYVADTVGNRIVKLDDELQPLAEFPMETPTRIQATGNRQMEAVGLQGRFLLDEELKWIKSEQPAFLGIAEELLAYREVSTADIRSYYEDNKNKLVWYYESEHVVQYRPETGQFRALYVGLLNNGYGKVRITPYQNQIAVLFDDRLLLFDRSSGEWQKTIEFPRVEPDGIYDTTTDGENSHYFDEPASTIYLVQGFRIIAINLENGRIETLFRQTNANLGPLVYDQGKLYFTLQSDIEEKYYGENSSQRRSTEIISLDLDTGSLFRYQVEGFWLMDSVTKDELVLFAFNEPRYSTNKGKYMRYPLLTFE